MAGGAFTFPTIGVADTNVEHWSERSDGRSSRLVSTVGGGGLVLLVGTEAELVEFAYAISDAVANKRRADQVGGAS